MTPAPDLNRLIDDVAQRMATADPPADLGVRIVAALEPRTDRRWLWLLMPAATAVAVIFLIARHANVPSPTPAAVQRTEARPRAATPLRLPAEAEAAPGVALAQRNLPTVTPGLGVLAWERTALDPLTAMAPLTMDSIQPQALAIRPLETTPLNMPAVDGDEGRH